MKAWKFWNTKRVLESVWESRGCGPVTQKALTDGPDTQKGQGMMSYASVETEGKKVEYPSYNVYNRQISI